MVSLLLFLLLIVGCSGFLLPRSKTASPFKPLSSAIDQSFVESETQSDGIFIKGKHKWLGGAVDSEGRIYGIPSNAKEVICLAPPSPSSREQADVTNSRDGEYEMHTIPLPHEIAEGQFKWLRGIIASGCLYGIPAWSQDGILRVDIASYWKDKESNSLEEDLTSYATVVPLPENVLDYDASRWLWHGASLNQNQTAIYAIPSNAHHVLKLDLATQETSLLDIPTDKSKTTLELTNKWYGGILGDDNCIFGVPYAASGVLQIDANTDTVEIIGEDRDGEGDDTLSKCDVNEYNFHGGIFSKRNGKIYCFPAHHSHVLTINTRFEDGDSHARKNRLDLLPIHRAPYDKDEVTRYKWLGGSIGIDGNIYGMPSDASSILFIDTEENTASTFGQVSSEKNKYQGGTLADDGFIYAICSNANNILCIDSNPSEKDEDEDEHIISFKEGENAFTIGDIYAITGTKRKDKWQGT